MSMVLWIGTIWYYFIRGLYSQINNGYKHREWIISLVHTIALTIYFYCSRAKY